MEKPGRDCGGYSARWMKNTSRLWRRISPFFSADNAEFRRGTEKSAAICESLVLVKSTLNITNWIR